MYDVIVVGAGPSGSNAARVLAERGFRVLLLDSAKFPRLKVCGGGIGWRVFRDYRRLVDVPEEYMVKANISLFVSPSGYTVEVDASSPEGYLIPRTVFDHSLVRAAVDAGAELREGVTVTGVVEEDSRVRVFTKSGEVVEGSVAVGADGVYSVVARSLGLQPANWLRDNAFCPVAYVPAPRPGRGEYELEFYLGFMGEGYAWIFRHYDHLNVGIGTLRKNYRVPPDKALYDFMRNHPISSKKIRLGGESIKSRYIPYNGMLRRLYSRRVLLVGDAGGFVNTLTGEGIWMAMKTGELAAEAVTKALETGELLKNFRSYQRRVETHPEIGEELKYGRILRDMFFSSPRLFDEYILRAREDKKLAKLLGDLVFARKPYPELVKQLARELPLALTSKVLAAAPVKSIQLLLGYGDPYFPGEGVASRCTYCTEGSA